MKRELSIKIERAAFMTRRGHSNGRPHSIVGGIGMRDYHIQAVHRSAKEHDDQALRSTIRVFCRPSARSDPDEGESAEDSCRIQKIAPTHMDLH